jgi:hypothetical protein
VSDLERVQEKLSHNQGQGSVDRTNKIQKTFWHLRIRQNILKLAEGFNINAIYTKYLLNMTE